MKKIISGMLLAFVFLPLNSLAAEYKANERVFIDQPVNDDLYLAGEEVRVRTEIKGDLFAGANEVIIDSKIMGDLFAGGNLVDIKGDLNDDLKAVGQSIQIDSKIGGDVMVVGENLTLEDTSSVGGDFIFAGTKIRLEAPVSGTVRGTGKNIYINSEIKENVFIYNSGKIVLGPEAKIMGNLTYSSLNKIEIPEGVVIGEITFKENQIPSKEGIAGIIAGFSLYEFLSALFFGLILIGFIRYFSLHNTNRSMQTPLKSLSMGFLFAIIVPIATFILMISLIGIPLGLAVFAMYFIALYVSTILAAMLIGRYLIKIDETSGFGRIYGSFFLGALIYMILGIIPFVGIAIKFLLMLIALGGFFLGNIDRFHELRKKKLL